jgi:hypothetical protein
MEEYLQSIQNSTKDPRIKLIIDKLIHSLFKVQTTELDETITEEDWKKKILKWPENTSTSQ